MVPTSILEKYVGTYALDLPASSSTQTSLEITLVAGALQLGGRPLTPLSATTFGGGAHLQFFMDDAGRVTHMIIHTAGGDHKATRIP
jgi:hypothetical protein